MRLSSVPFDKVHSTHLLHFCFGRLQKPAGSHSMTMSETNGNGTVAEKAAVDGKPDSPIKKPKLDESVEERDFDEATQKALEEIDANQNEIDALNERKCYDVSIEFKVSHLLGFTLYFHDIAYEIICFCSNSLFVFF